MGQFDSFSLQYYNAHCLVNMPTTTYMASFHLLYPAIRADA